MLYLAAVNLLSDIELIKTDKAADASRFGAYSTPGQLSRRYSHQEAGLKAQSRRAVYQGLKPPACYLKLP